MTIEVKREEKRVICSVSRAAGAGKDTVDLGDEIRASFTDLAEPF